MINKVNVLLFKQFQGFYCLSKLIIWLNHDVFLISSLLRMVSSLNHIYLLVFMLFKVNVRLFRQFLRFYCLSKLIIWLNDNAFLISLLLRIVSSLNHIHLPVFMLYKVNVRLFKQFLGFELSIKAYNMVKSRWFHNIISLLFRIVSSLSHI